jgi:putative acetyltransferase
MSSLTLTLTRAPNDAVRLLVGELEAILSAEYPPEQRHGLPVDAIFQPHVRFFVATLDDAPAGCGGIALFDAFAEVKRMYVRPAARGQGIAQAILARLEAETRGAHLPILRLETGDKQTDALRLYRRYGFTDCAPFGDYAHLPPHTISTSIFLEKPVAQVRDKGGTHTVIARTHEPPATSTAADGSAITTVPSDEFCPIRGLYQ